jgi:NAD(P)-dependent dehydrogenase (short-subunit alcohol dehydrogenase family)
LIFRFFSKFKTIFGLPSGGFFIFWTLLAQIAILMGKVVLITGGSSGLGNRLSASKGFIVYGTSRNPDRISNSVFPLVTLDVRDTESIQAAVAKVIALTGRLDVVINNAGIGITGPLEEIPMQRLG